MSMTTHGDVLCDVCGRVLNREDVAVLLDYGVELEGRTTCGPCENGDDPEVWGLRGGAEAMMSSEDSLYAEHLEETEGLHREIADLLRDVRSLHRQMVEARDTMERKAEPAREILIVEPMNPDASRKDEARAVAYKLLESAGPYTLMIWDWHSAPPEFQAMTPWYDDGDAHIALVFGDSPRAFFGRDPFGQARAAEVPLGHGYSLVFGQDG